MTVYYTNVCLRLGDRRITECDNFIVLTGSSVQGLLYIFHQIDAMRIKQYAKPL
jgi:hypothetical protein